MALIRQADARTMARDAIVLDLGDLAAQGELLKARARAEAERIVSDAAAERKRLLDGAADEGRRLGLAQGLEQGRREGIEQGRRESVVAESERLTKLQQAWLAALQTFESERERMLIE